MASRLLVQISQIQENSIVDYRLTTGKTKDFPDPVLVQTLFFLSTCNHSAFHCLSLNCEVFRTLCEEGLTCNATPRS